MITQVSTCNHDPLYTHMTCGACAKDKIQYLQQELLDIVYCCYKFDDKPHQLFNALRLICQRHGDADIRGEAMRLMDEAYINWRDRSPVGHVEVLRKSEP